MMSTSNNFIMRPNYKYGKEYAVVANEGQDILDDLIHSLNKKTHRQVIIALKKLKYSVVFNKYCGELTPAEYVRLAEKGIILGTGQHYFSCLEDMKNGQSRNCPVWIEKIIPIQKSLKI